MEETEKSNGAREPLESEMHAGGPEDEKESVAKIAVRAAYWFLIAVAVFCVVFPAFFPFSAMRFYSGIGARNMTLTMAERVVDREVETKRDAQTGKDVYALRPGKAAPAFDSKFTEALYYYAYPIAVERMDRNITENGAGHRSTIQSAEKVLKIANG